MTFLSGGLDSSALVAFGSQHSPEPLKTFSVGFSAPDDAYNETEKARKVADCFGCEHTEFEVSPRIEELLLPLVRALDEPFGDSSAIPTYLISQETRKHATVALSGVGGDELFGGYPRYMGLLAANCMQPIPTVLKRAVSWWAKRVPDKGGSVNWVGRSKRFLRDVHRPLNEQYMHWTSFLVPELIEQLVEDDQDGRDSWLEVDRWRAGMAPSVQRASSPSIVALEDVSSYLPSDLLCHTDRVSMAHSLEVRVPFLDIDLVEFMSRIPLREKLRGLRLKSLLKSILSPLVPKEILLQKKKGFSIPLPRWLRDELGDVLEDCLSPSRLRSRGFFNPVTVNRLRAEHDSGRENHAGALWSLLIFEIWYREYMEV